MQQPFFGLDPAIDPIYEALRAPDHPNSIRAREYFDELWNIAAPFLSVDLRTNARAQFQQVFWEVYLAATLRTLGKRLVPRANRGPRSGGPDLLQLDPEVFYEAIVVSSGTGPDAVVEAAPLVARDVPDAEISLRLTSGLSDKRAAYTRYRQTSMVSPGVPFVIAINAGAVPSASRETTLPRIVRTVFPFGHEVLHFDPATWRRIGRSYTYRSALAKRSGASVPTSFFADDLARGISAILYSCVDPFNWPPGLGQDFVLVHNPQAANVLPRDLFANAREFWIEGDELRGEVTAG